MSDAIRAKYGLHNEPRYSRTEATAKLSEKRRHTFRKVPPQNNLLVDLPLIE